MIQQNYILLNIFPLLLKNDSDYTPLMTVINIVNMRIDYDYSRELSENDVAFTPSIYSLIHILDYTSMDLQIIQLQYIILIEKLILNLLNIISCFKELIYQKISFRSNIGN